MSNIRPSRWSNQRWRVGAVLLLLLALAGGSFLWHSASRAGASAFTLQTHATFAKPDQLIVAVSVENGQKQNLTGTLHVDLLNAKGQVLHSAKQNLQQNDSQGAYRFAFKANRKNAEQFKVRTRLADKSRQVDLPEILLAKGHETSLMASREFFSGSSSALLCKVHGIRTLTESVPLAGSDVVVRLRDKNNKAHPLYKGRTNGSGQSLAQFQMPNVPAGNYTLEVTTKSPLGEETLKQDVRIRADAKILLISDKPIYQPGQVIHIRALALRPYDLKPVGKAKLLFEVEDSKGNKVYKKSYTTSAFGVASVDFQLADEVNMGRYQIRATIGEKQAEKTVTVKRYVLPKFKVNIKTAKRFYLPKETIEGSIQADYFFGKPIANGKVEITASTFDVNFKKFFKSTTTTDENGHVKFKVTLPNYFVGQPLQKGDAIVKLDVKITDTADQVVKVVKSYPVSDQPIKIAVLPESGKIVPDMENRVFVAATYPDGSPAQCEVLLYQGKKIDAKSKALGKLQTNIVGLAEFRFTPDAKQLRQGNWGQRNIEMLGGDQRGWAPQILYDLTAAAKDTKGATAQVSTTLNAHPLGENVLLRLNKAIYKTGDSMDIDVRSSAGLPTVYLDIVRSGQVLLSRWMEVKKGQANHKLDLPPTLFGSLEVHAYQMLSTGEIIRDSRVVYVQPRGDLNIKVTPNKSVFTPGENGRIRFHVTDAAGKPTAAALGVIVVDEAVYALQELQPGLEKVYFTLQKELLEPQVQAKFKPADNLPMLIRQPNLPALRQQVAQALLTAVKVAPPKRWNVAPELQRRRQFQQRVQQIGWGIWNYAHNKGDFMRKNKTTKEWEFEPNLLQKMVAVRYINKQSIQGPFGEPINVADLQKLHKDFDVATLANNITAYRINNLAWRVIYHTNRHRAKYFKNGSWHIGQGDLKLALQNNRGTQTWLQDAWGQPLRLLTIKKKGNHFQNQPQFHHYKIVSLGPDGKLATKDDVTWDNGQTRWAYGNWWMQAELARNADGGLRGGLRNERRMFQRGRVNRFAGGFGGGGAPEANFGAPVPQAAAAPGGAIPTDAAAMPHQSGGKKAGGNAPPRIRQYFPETMLWQPALITNDQGVADLAVNFADSITTWRLSASANSRGGALGGVTVPLKVFQDFFVDIDLPVNWTQDDEVDFPVAVFNYLDQPQTVKIELKQGKWFELLEGKLTQTLNLKPNEVTSVKFRIKANRIGNHPLTVMAYGSKKSDAVRRVIEVVPNGERKEVVINDRLKGNVTKTVTIPPDAIPDSYKMLVRIYPGVMSQVLEGTEGMLRLPGG